MLQQSLDKYSGPPEPPKKAKIVIDQREDELFEELLEGMGADIERRVIEVGDFLCSERLVVERKTRADFEQSIMDGRLFTQLQNMIANFERVVVVVEGVSDEERLTRNAILGAYAAIIADFGASLMFTRDKEATAELVYSFAKHEQLAKKITMRVFAKRKTLTPNDTMRSIVEMLPLIGPKSAKKLLEHFGTVEKVMSASEQELSEVEGIGPKRAKLIRAILRHHYKEDEES